MLSPQFWLDQTCLYLEPISSPNPFLPLHPPDPHAVLRRVPPFAANYRVALAGATILHQGAAGQNQGGNICLHHAHHRPPGPTPFPQPHSCLPIPLHRDVTSPLCPDSHTFVLPPANHTHTGSFPDVRDELLPAAAAWVWAPQAAPLRAEGAAARRGGGPPALLRHLHEPAQAAGLHVL
jgi:hypothetical protein